MPRAAAHHERRLAWRRRRGGGKGACITAAACRDGRGSRERGGATLVMVIRTCCDGACIL